MSFKVLRPQLKTLLQNTGKFVEVSDAPKLQFDGYPAAWVRPSSNDNNYETTSENVRVYTFDVGVVYSTKDGNSINKVDDATAALEEVVDTVLDAFDQEDLKGSSQRVLGLGLPADYTFLNVFATPAQWGEVEGQNLLVATLTVRVRISVDVS
jgi:hypothetical protein